MLISGTLKWIIVMKNKYSIDFSRTLTLGRQQCPKEHLKRTIRKIKRIEKDRGTCIGNKDVSEIYQDDGYSEKFWRYLGAQTVDSMDYSEYEHANIIHDLNKDIPSHLLDHYDVVFDGGTMEHVFNYPQALKNAMSLVKVGGYLIIMAPTNDWCGHGFYQLSPCVFSGIINQNNGFTLLEMSLMEIEKITGDKYIKVIHGNGNLYTKGRGLLLIVAKRIGAIPCKLSVMQEDYEKIWNKDTKPHKKLEILMNRIKSMRCVIFVYSKIRYYLRRYETYNIDVMLRELITNS